MAKILLMEDDLSFSFEFAEQLRAAGHDVVPTKTGTEALNCILEEPFDIVITDLFVHTEGRSIPDGGIGLIGSIKMHRHKLPHLKRLPIIAITGAADNLGMEFILDKAETFGADASFAKPINLNVILAKIEELLAAYTPG